jgi:hypothetical protein
MLLASESFFLHHLTNHGAIFLGIGMDTAAAAPIRTRLALYAANLADILALLGLRKHAGLTIGLLDYFPAALMAFAASLAMCRKFMTKTGHSISPQ